MKAAWLAGMKLVARRPKSFLATTLPAFGSLVATKLWAVGYGLDTLAVTHVGHDISMMMN